MPNYVKNLIIGLFALLLVGLIVFKSKPAHAPGERTNPPEDKKPLTRILFAGDIMLSRNVEDKMAKANDYSLPFQKIAEKVKSADISFANLESPITDKGKHFIPNSLVFNANPLSIQGLQLAGFDILSIANNHSLDQGQYGIQYTYDWLKSHGILPAGAGVPTVDVTTAVIEKNKINFGFLAYSFTAHNDGSNDSSPYIGNFHDLTRLKQDILTLRGHFADVVIVSMHAGTEYTRTPNTEQVAFAHAAIDAGADLVIGAHPHWIQTTETYKDKWIFYSLGNFVFDQMWSQETREGLTVLITYDETELKKIELQPVIIDDFCCVRPANSEESQTILKKINLTNPVLIEKN